MNDTMNSDTTTPQSALSVLRQQYGEHLNGPQESTETQMRDTLKQNMSLDEQGADRVIKELSQNGQLVYIPTEDEETSTDTSGTGPVISMPNTQSADGGAPLITTASPAMLMGITDDSNGSTGGDFAGSAEGDTVERLGDINYEALPGSGTVADLERVGSRDPRGYWRIG